MKKSTTNTPAFRAVLWSLLLAAGLLLAACGDSPETAQPAGAAVPQPLAEEAPREAAPPSTTSTTQAPPPTTTAPPTTTTAAPPTTVAEIPEPDPVPPPEEPVDELRAELVAAFEAMIAEGTALITTAVHQPGLEPDYADFTLTGSVDLTVGVFRGEVVVAGETVELIVAGDAVYLALPDLPRGATWELIPNEPDHAPSTALDMPFGFLTVIEALSPDEPVVEVGTDEETSRHLQLPLDVELLLEAAGHDPHFFGAWSTDQIRASAEVWIDGEGRVTQVLVVVEPAGKLEAVTFTAMTELANFGEIEAPEPPAEDDYVSEDDFGVPFERLELGDCWIDLSYGGPLYGAELVPCEDAHQAEVFATLHLPHEPGAPWPGDDEVWNLVGEMCLAEFEGYVGEPYQTSALDFSIVYPSEESWAYGDRLFVCSATRPDGGPLTGTVRQL